MSIVAKIPPFIVMAKKEIIMFSVTQKAGEELKNILAKITDEVKSIRIFMQDGGCAGPSLGMALDETAPDDEVFVEEGITFLVNRPLFEQVKPVDVDFVSGPQGTGFILSSSLVSACGSGCSCS